MRENVRRFTQAAHTSSLQQQQISLLGWTANSPIASQILNSDTIQDSIPLHPDIAVFAPFLSMPRTIEKIGSVSTAMSREDFRYNWKRCREYASSGRSGIHIGHFKASCMSDYLTDIDRKFIEISMTYGAILHLWYQATDVMIPKKESSCRVDKL
jgi:hypothetical protein